MNDFDEMETASFGYKQVKKETKERLVDEVFSSVSSRYDLMNDLMSFGIHRIWKRMALNMLGIQPGDIILDAAGGTGDLTVGMADMVGETGSVVLADINDSMLLKGRDRLLDIGKMGNVKFVQANVEKLPFLDNSFDGVTISFGLRNVTNKENALRSMYRILKSSGRLLILEFSHVKNDRLKQLYDWYSFNVIPQLGQWIVGDSDSYQYLAESIRMHPDQEKLKLMMEAVGFVGVSYHNLSGGIAAVHIGDKL